MGQPGDNAARDTRLAEALIEYHRRMDRGEAVDREELVARYPDVAEALRSHWEIADEVASLADADDGPHDPPVSPPPLDVIRYFGDYELLEELARGGMGVVYKARQVTLKRLVAVKLVLAGQLAGADDIRRFHTEAQAAANLQHPNIVAIHEVGEHQGQHYLSMDYVEGSSLARRLAGGPLAPVEAARLVREVAEAVDYAHSKGVIHRDLKPANILLNQAGRPRVTDFGLARIDLPSPVPGEGQGEGARGDIPSPVPGEGQGEGAGPTRTGQILGTPSYMSPEQAAGKAGRIGPASDVYALGATLYAALTGRPPFQAATAIETLDQVRRDPPLSPRALNRAVPRDLETICLKCLEKSPSQRYSSAAELAADLGRWLNHEPIRARPIGRLARLMRWSRRNKGWAAAIAVAAAAASGLVTAAVLFQHSRVLAARRESVVQELQRVRLTPHSAGWSQQAWQLVERAAAIRSDSDLRDEAAATLAGVDARHTRTFAGGASTMLFDDQGRRLLMGGTADSPARLWDSRTGWVVAAEVLGPGPVAFRPDGAAVQLIRKDERTLLLRDLGRQRPLRELEIPGPEKAGATEGPDTAVMAMTPDGSSIALARALADQSCQILVWNTHAVGHVSSVPKSVSPSSPPTALALTPDGTLLAAGDADGRIAVWPLSSPERVDPLPSGRNRIQCLAFARSRHAKELKAPTPTAGGWLLAAGDAGGTVTAWDLAAGAAPTVCHGSHHEVSAVAFSPDGTTLASAGRGQTRLWDLRSGRLLLELWTGDTMSALAFSPDGRRLAVGVTAYAPGSVDIWDLDWGRGIQTLRGLVGQVSKLCFSRDGRRLGALSHTWQVTVWDLHAGCLCQVLDVPKGLVADNAALAFDPRGRQFAFAAGR